MIVADSDVLIDALRGREPARGRIALEIASGKLATTAVNVLELLSGARTERERHIVQTLVEGLNVLPFDDEAARHAAETRLLLESRGNGIRMADYLIAGVCLSRSAMLLTRNRAHFDRVPGLVLSAFSPPMEAHLDRAGFLDREVRALTTLLPRVRREDGNVQGPLDGDVNLGIVTTTRRTQTHPGPCIRVQIWTDDPARGARWQAGARVMGATPAGLPLEYRLGDEGGRHYLEFSWDNHDLNGFEQWTERVDACVAFFVAARDEGRIP